MNWELLNVREKEYPNNPLPDSKPLSYEKMIDLAKVLSKGMPHVRVDFNYVNNQIYFGEMTFYHCGARKPFIPYDFNVEIGRWIDLSLVK